MFKISAPYSKISFKAIRHTLVKEMDTLVLVKEMDTLV